MFGGDGCPAVGRLASLTRPGTPGRPDRVAVAPGRRATAGAAPPRALWPAPLPVVALMNSVPLPVKPPVAETSTGAAGRPKDPEKRAAILAAAKRLFPSA